MMEIEHVRPADIEQTSFRIIEKEIREMGLELPEDKKHVLLRVIHTTADFDYLDTMTFSKNAVEKAEDAFRRSAGSSQIWRDRVHLGDGGCFQCSQAF